ncbi:MAG: phosphatidylglycerol lysyltransferase domain-containing protein [Vicinamibacterales bacterium]
MPVPEPADASARALAALQRDGTDAVSFQALKAGTHWWQDRPPPEGSGGLVAYVPSGRSWIAIGTPLAAPARRAAAVQRFCAAARAEHRRAVFLGVEDRAPVAGCRTLLLGLQPILRPAHWHLSVRQRPRLREQLRRARAKGVTVRAVPSDALAAGTPLRAAVERLRREWLDSRAMEPLAFLVAVEPFHAADAHRYVVAEHGGQPVQFLSAVPIAARQGWLLEDMLRGRRAPNGTTELLIDALMRDLGGDPAWVTPGLTPLTGPIRWWLRLTRWATVALYDFSGLQRFRARLHPAAWTPVWMAWDRGTAPGVLLDVLRAFAAGRLIRFATRSLVWHPNGPPWAVAVPLVAWTALLFALVASGRAGLLGYSTAALAAWVAFDVVLAWLLFAVARRPRPWPLAGAAAVALFDAVLSLAHLARVGVGGGLPALLRLTASAGPVIGTSALAWAAWRARARRPAAAWR